MTSRLDKITGLQELQERKLMNMYIFVLWVCLAIGFLHMQSYFYLPDFTDTSGRFRIVEEKDENFHEGLAE